MTRWLAALAAASALTACAVAGDNESQDTAPSSPPPSTSASSAASMQAESATDLLECDGLPSSIGGRADDFGPEGGGATADAALGDWVATTVFGVPRSGYEELGAIGDRSVYLRDPLGVLAGSPSLLDTYAEGVALPDDAIFSGYRTDDGLELWFTSTDTAAYVVTPEGVEHWPRADPPIGCA